jgi:hypothetical protein
VLDRQASKRHCKKKFFAGALSGEIMTPATSITVTTPVETFTVDTGLLRLDEVPGATVAQPPPTPEQIQAAEAVFSQDPQTEMAWGLLGVWTSSVLLHNLALEAFSAFPNEEKQEKQPKQPLPQTD